MTSIDMRAPAGFVPEVAVVYSAAGLATPVDDSHPLPVGERAFASALAIAPGVDQTPRRALLIACTTAGNAVLKLADDSLVTVPIDSGLSILPLSVKTVVVAGTTAAASYTNLG